jgi:hypothetical protein
MKDERIMDPEVSVPLLEMYILGVKDDCSKEPSNYAGNIIVFFGHPWYLFKDLTPHCY